MSWRERFREDNELLLGLVHGWPGKIYLIIGGLTFMSQIPARWTLCAGIQACGVSFVKGAVWASAWPLYWINQVTGSVLFRPFG